MFIGTILATLVIVAILGVYSGFLVDELREEVLLTLRKQGKSEAEIECLLYGTPMPTIMGRSYLYDRLMRAAAEVIPDSQVLRRERHLKQWVRVIAGAGVLLAFGIDMSYRLLK